jgi:small subunit ribosomal protein S6
MNKYESMIVLMPGLTEEEYTASIDKVKSVIESDGGVVENVDLWGKRRLAYEINKINEGYYVLFSFSAKPALPKELDRILRISDKVVRHMIIVLN